MGMFSDKRKVVPKEVQEVVDLLTSMSTKHGFRLIRRGAARWLSVTKLKADLTKKQAELEKELVMVKAKLGGK